MAATSDLRASQIADDDLRKIITWKESCHSCPAWKDVPIESKPIKSYWSQWDRLSLSNSVLCQRWESEAEDEVLWQFVIPSNLRNDILHELPTMETAGHVGTNKTLERVNKRFYWPGCTKDVKDWRKSLGMDKTRTTHLQPQADGIVECFNWTIEGMLSKFVAENQLTTLG